MALPLNRVGQQRWRVGVDATDPGKTFRSRAKAVNYALDMNARGYDAQITHDVVVIQSTPKGWYPARTKPA